MATIENFLGILQPVEGLAEGVIAAALPGTAPIINQISELQSVVTGVIGALDGHFGPGKIALPAPPTGLTNGG